EPDKQEKQVAQKPDQKQPDNKQPDTKPGDKKPADKNPADKKPADKKPADKKPDDDKPVGPGPVNPGPVDPPPAPPEIKPVALDQEKVTRKLPSTFNDVAVGGGGRYLILSMPQLRKLCVFDVSAGQVKGYVPLGADNVKFAAGLDKLFVSLPDNSLLQRWDLATLNRDLTVTTAGGKITALCMGSGSTGPLLVTRGEFGAAAVGFLDPRTLKPLDVQRGGDGHIDGGEGTQVRASADGRVFGFWRLHVSPSGLQTLV